MKNRIKFFLIFTTVLYLRVNAYTADNSEYIKVFFNQPESAVSPSESEISNPEKGIDDALVDFIETAKDGDSVYLCFYDSTTRKVTDAFNDAAEVVDSSNIYHIMDDGYGDNNGAVSDPGIYSFPNSIDDGTKSTPFMHNKFAVIIDTVAETGRVWTGSYNPSDNGTYENNNNALWIESYDLAELYAQEFLYMWNSGNGRFSTHKSTSDNTAESVTVSGDRIDVYFSPYTGDVKTNTSMILEDLIDEATHSVYFNIFTFSVNEARLKEAIIDAHDRGLEVKGVVEATQSSAVQSAFREEGVNVVMDANEGNLHHKFCVIDYGTSRSKVVTGSYNWTPAAKDENDENFLVIHSSSVADLYRAEFIKNYELAGIIATDNDAPAVNDVLVYPSPLREGDSVTIGFTLSSSVTNVVVRVYTLMGERVSRFSPEFSPGTYNEEKWDLKNSAGKGLASGLYIVKVEATTGDGTFSETEKFVVIK